ncbi:redox-regulated ATPase YchF [Halorutilales archaeon Cl-col2-1]
MITVGLAGKPNAGKSTFFKAATSADVEVGNYPFTTIEANRGVTHVRTDCPCLELDERCGNCRDGRRYVPVEIIDVAGLVPEAHKGRGLGNQFLDELRQADVIVHVVDAAGATDSEGEPVAVGEHSPVEDVDFLEEELDMWTYGILRDNWEKIERRSRTPDFDFESELTDVLTGVGATENEIRLALRRIDQPESFGDWDDSDIRLLAREIRRITKPIAVAANKVDIAPDDLIENILSTEGVVVPTSGESELALRNGDESGVLSYAPGDSEFGITGDGVSDSQLKALGKIEDLIDEYGGTGIQKVLNDSVYGLLERVTVYPVENESDWTDGSGNVLPDAFLLERGSTPVDLAYSVHSDVGEGYLHAVDARTRQRIANDYEVEEGDVIKIVSTA